MKAPPKQNISKIFCPEMPKNYRIYIRFRKNTLTRVLNFAYNTSGKPFVQTVSKSSRKGEALLKFSGGNRK